jgi:hypothetical protein
MYAKRWSTLCVFFGGSISGAALVGAALIGWHSADRTPESSRHAGGAQQSLELDVPAPNLVSLEERADTDRAVAQSARDAAARVPAPHDADADDFDEASARAGRPFADVLAGLEAEYRKQIAAARSAELTASREGASDRAVPAPAEARSDAHEPSSADRVAQPSAAHELRRAVPPVTAPEAAPERVAMRELPETAPSLGATPAAPQRQEPVAVQQVTVVQQLAVLQYLQVLPPSHGGRAGRAPAAQRRAANRRIVGSLPSSISDTDNPWGFDLPPTVLVR